MKEKNYYKVVRDFKYKNRRCVVIELDRPIIGKNCDGYIELKDSEIKDSYNDYGINSDELTYQGDLKFGGGLDTSDGKTYIGFDSGHCWNDENPKSKTADWVEKTCKKIVDELEKR